MERSDEIAKLATALAKAQGVIEDAEKDSLNPHFQSRYASLASVRHAVRKPLSDNGIAYLQLPRANDKSIEIRTVLLHESGEFISETLEMPVGQMLPQAIGSAISYARRYGLVSILGLASDENDDGEIAHGRPGRKSESNPAAPAQARERVRPTVAGERRHLPPAISNPPSAPLEPTTPIGYVAAAKAALRTVATKEQADRWWISEQPQREAHGIAEGTPGFAALREAFRLHKRSLPREDEAALV
jgi:hypothetical protein